VAEIGEGGALIGHDRSPVAGAADVVGLLLADKRSENTRRAYRRDLEEFFHATYGTGPTEDTVRAFLQEPTPAMVAQVLRYKAWLLAEGRAEATVNRRLAAISSLVTLARRLGITDGAIRGLVDGERVVSYRDTRGISGDEARRLLRQPDRGTLKGQRDYALLLLLLENALRRAEIVGTTIGDYRAEESALTIRGKGRGTQSERITLSSGGSAAISAYLRARGEESDAGAPLFINVSPAYHGRGLTSDGLYKIVAQLARAAGLSISLSPHRLRHTSITMALDVSGGDIRRVQRLSRHARLETLRIYDDNRADLQGEMTEALSRLLATD
jgi:integrase/recombinase XerC